MFNRITGLCLALAISCSIPGIINADDIPPSTYPPRVAVMLLADSLSAKEGIDPRQVKSVLKAESNYNQNAVGDHGLALGVAQYHRDTFNRYEALFFQSTAQHLNYNSSTDQITLLTWQWKVFPQSKLAWSTYRALYLHYAKV